MTAVCKTKALLIDITERKEVTNETDMALITRTRLGHLLNVGKADIIDLKAAIDVGLEPVRCRPNMCTERRNDTRQINVSNYIPHLER